ATLTNLQTFPKPKIKKIVDTEYRTLAGKGVIRKQIEIGKSVPGGALELPVTVHYMTCFDGGCDPPAKEQATVTVNIVGAKAAPPGAAKPDSAKPIEGAKPDSASVGSDSNTTDTSTDATSSSEEAAAPTGTAISSASSLISGSSLFQFILLMIGGGLFALVMPCTYPMIPITISVFTKIAESRKGAVLPVAIVYGLGIVGSFNLVGLAIYFAIGGVASTSILDLASSPSLNLVIGIVFFIFALSFFGIITLRLPGSVSNIGVKFSGTSSLVGVLALGATLVVTSFTCTAPIMGPLLIYAGQDGDLARVMLGMTVFGLTMAVPFFWLSLFPGWVSSMPRAGGWMNTVKIFLGFLELAAALKFLSSAERVWGEGGAPLGLLPREALLMLWAVIFGVAGLYLLRAFRFKDDGDEGIGPGRLFVSLLIMSLALWFHMGSRGMRLDWITESQMPPYNVEYVVGGIATSPAEDHGVEVDNVAEGMEKAKELGRLALVDFTGPLCSNCIAMEKSVFPKFKHLLDQFVMIKLNTDENPRQEENRAYQLQLVKSLARPIYAVVDPANPNVPIEVFGRADLPSGKDFGAFLKRHVSE
ncbi:MAG: cytochrome c biogenesis protein CcdA, partial [Planctomycetota bacterium]